MRIFIAMACAAIAGFTPADEDVAGLILERSKADGARADAITTVSDIVRYGKTAIRFAIQKGDCVAADCAADRERVELKSRDTEMEGGHSTYRWSFYLPAGFQSVWPAREFIAQFHQQGGKPAMLFSLEPEGLVFESRFLDGAKPLLIPATSLRGAWHDVAVAVSWSTGKGSVRIEVDGEAVFTRAMQTMSETEAYFKIGLYRAHVSRAESLPEQVMYVDGIARVRR